MDLTRPQAHVKLTPVSQSLFGEGFFSPAEDGDYHFGTKIKNRFAHNQSLPSVSQFGVGYKAPMQESGHSVAGQFANSARQLTPIDKLSLGLGALGDIMNIYNGYKQTKLAKQQFNLAKDAYQQQFDINRKLTNSALEDRQRARVAQNPHTAKSVGEYMAQYGV